jgi:hypothetical protein
MTWGKETTLCLFLASLAFVADRWDRPKLLGAALGLLFLARPDGLALAGVLLAARTAATRRLPKETLAIAAAIVLPWLAFSWWSFGGLVPASLGSKVFEGGALAGRGAYLLGFHLYGWDYPATAVALLPTALIALWGFVLGFSRLRLLAAWAAGHAAVYALLHPPPYMTYYVPLAYAAAIAAAFALHRLHDRRRWAARIATCALVAVHVLCLYHAWGLLKRNGRDVFTYSGALREWDFLFYEYEAYAQVGRWLRDHTPADARVAVIEAGILGYESRRPMTDQLGVVTPDAPKMSFREWIEAYAPRYAAFRCDFEFLEHMRGSPLTYAPLRRFRSDSYLDMVVYEKGAAGVADPSPIVLEPPRYDPTRADPPTFRWRGRGPFEVDFFFLGMIATPPFGVDVWYQTSREGAPFAEAEYRLDAAVWERVPRGQRIYWRVRSVAPDAPHRSTAWSDMASFVK